MWIDARDTGDRPCFINSDQAVAFKVKDRNIIAIYPNGVCYKVKNLDDPGLEGSTDEEKFKTFKTNFTIYRLLEKKAERST